MSIWLKNGVGVERSIFHFKKHAVQCSLTIVNSSKTSTSKFSGWIKIVGCIFKLLVTENSNSKVSTSILDNGI